MLLGGQHVQERLRDLAQCHRVLNELLADDRRTGGCQAFVPSGIILAATWAPMPLNESRRDLLPAPDEDKSS